MATHITVSDNPTRGQKLQVWVDKEDGSPIDKVMKLTGSIDGVEGQGQITFPAEVTLTDSEGHTWTVAGRNEVSVMFETTL